MAGLQILAIMVKVVEAPDMPQVVVMVVEVPAAMERVPMGRPIYPNFF
jgi:hypothetical protein